jgi:hypothetical protein
LTPYITSARLGWFHQWKAPNPLSSESENRIRHGGRNRRRTRFANALWLSAQLEYFCVNLRTGGHIDEREVREVPLLNLTVHDGDTLLQRRGESKNNAALHLLLDEIRVDRNAAIDHAVDSRDPEAVVELLHFRDLRDHAAK